jgi:hypothetical protein
MLWAFLQEFLSWTTVENVMKLHINFAFSTFLSRKNRVLLTFGRGMRFRIETNFINFTVEVLGEKISVKFGKFASFCAVLWIRIHFFRIRIQSLTLETNTDPDLDSGSGSNTDPGL